MGCCSSRGAVQVHAATPTYDIPRPVGEVLDYIDSPFEELSKFKAGERGTHSLTHALAHSLTLAL